MIVLDTNVVSELMLQAPEPDVVRWVDSFSAADIFVTAVTAAELMYGVARLPNGRRKRELHVKVEGLLTEDFRDKVLPFDALSATNYADIVAAREHSGHQISMADGQIAAICRNWNAGLATRNVSDFIDTGIHTIRRFGAAVTTACSPAFNASDGTVIGSLHRRHRAVEFQDMHRHSHARQKIDVYTGQSSWGSGTPAERP